MRRSLTILCLLALTATANGQVAAQNENWTPLFDGETLEGWTQRGGKAVYAVEDGVIVGRSVPSTSNSFLCTDKNYGDFILELEFKVHPELNSGIQIRSHSLPDYKNGRVHGYQVEIDPSARAWSTGIYDESRRGWLYPLTDKPAAQAAFKQGAWNHVRVEAIGPSIKTWLNGVPAADLVDTMTLSGFIALQVHGVGDRQEPLEVRWRNIRIQDLGHSEWEPLFDGKSLAGWTATPGGEWKIENGVLHGMSVATDPRHGILLSDERYGDFTARIVYRANKGNSGFYFRCEKSDDGLGVHGFQAEIDPEKDAGGLYETAGRGWVSQPTAEAVEKYFKPGEWNEMTVSANGGRITVRVNNQKAAELLDDPGRREGHFGLQMHGGQDMDIEFKSVDLLVSKADSLPAAREGRIAEAIVADGAEVVKLHGGFAFTEGPAKGPDEKIYFSDIPNSRIQTYDPASGELGVARENTGKANGLMFDDSGALYACEGGNRQLTKQVGDNIKVLAARYDGKKFNSPNDLDLDDRGGVYFTDPRYGSRDGMEMDVEGVYYLSATGKLTRVIDDLVRPNGLILSLDKQTLYVADNGTTLIYRYDVREDGSLANRRQFTDMGGQGGCDGMTIDAQGNVYGTAQGHVWIWNPDGELITKIKPPEAPANCTFGGPNNKTLYITARTGFYSIEMNVAGRE